jgi:hypothetical protein
LTNLRLIALAIASAKDVLPTPGGPTKVKIGDESDFVFAFTAKNSIILSLILSKPKWYESNIS